MGALADGADILMPNLTEASILTGTAYAGADLDDAQVNDLLQALLDLGARNVVLKGIDRNDGRIRNFVANAQAGVDAKEEIVNEKLPFMCHGTGDAFASALIGAVMAGLDLAAACRIASVFVCNAMLSTRHQPDYENRGVSFELCLGELTNLVD